MKKREFLRNAAKVITLVPVATGSVAANGRLFGTPASISPTDPVAANKLRLSFARSSVPIEVWDQMLAFTSGLQRLSSSDDAKRQFNASPRNYFEAAGVQTTERFTRSREVAMARLIMDYEAQDAVSKGDYQAFLRRIQDFNLPTIPDADGLTSKIAAQLRNDIRLYRRVKSAIESAGNSNPKIAADALLALDSKFSADDTVSVSTDTIVAADVFAVVQVSVAAEVIAISAVVVAVIAVVAVKCDPNACDSPDFIPYGSISRLDQRIIDGASTAITLARLLGNESFQVNVARDLIAKEMEAVLTAAEQVGLIRYDIAQRAALKSICIAAAERSFGLSI